MMGFASYFLKLECHPLFHFSVNLLCSQVLDQPFLNCASQRVAAFRLARSSAAHIPLALSPGDLHIHTSLGVTGMF